MDSDLTNEKKNAVPTTTTSLSPPPQHTHAQNTRLPPLLNRQRRVEGHRLRAHRLSGTRLLPSPPPLLFPPPPPPPPLTMPRPGATGVGPKRDPNATFLPKIMMDAFLARFYGASSKDAIEWAGPSHGGDGLSNLGDGVVGLGLYELTHSHTTALRTGRGRRVCVVALYVELDADTMALWRHPRQPRRRSPHIEPESGLLVSSLCFLKLNLCRYGVDGLSDDDGIGMGELSILYLFMFAAFIGFAVGRRKLNSVVTHSLKAPGFNQPLNLKSGNLVSSLCLCFRMQLVPLHRGAEEGRSGGHEPADKGAGAGHQR
jgi:hypothetical protein